MATPSWNTYNHTLSWAAGAAGSAPHFVAAVNVLREKADKLYCVRFSNTGCRDEHLPLLVEALHHSECELREIDLCFNKLTGGGLRFLCETLAREGMCGYALTHIYLGGNPVEDEARAACVELLRAKRPDLALDFELTLRGAEELAVVSLSLIHI